MEFKAIYSTISIQDSLLSWNKSSASRGYKIVERQFNNVMGKVTGDDMATLQLLCKCLYVESKEK